MNKERRLLVFAHSLEASAFIKRLKFIPVNGRISHLYQNAERDYLLVSGEGIQRVTQKLAWVLGRYREEIAAVYNFGIAGALTPQLVKHQCYAVQTAYAEAAPSQMEFKSFSPQKWPRLERRDAVSARSRVMGEDVQSRVSYLSCFGDLVDRELWGIGSVCSMMKIPFYAVKLIVDFPGHQKDPDCQTIREQGEAWSGILFEEFQKGIVLSQSEENASEASFELPSEFYATYSQKIKIKNLLRSLKLQTGVSLFEIWKQVDLVSFQQMKTLPKKRTQLLIQKMEQLVYPSLREENAI